MNSPIPKKIMKRLRGEIYQISIKQKDEKEFLKRMKRARIKATYYSGLQITRKDIWIVYEIGTRYKDKLRAFKIRKNIDASYETI